MRLISCLIALLLIKFVAHGAVRHNRVFRDVVPPDDPAAYFLNSTHWSLIWLISAALVVVIAAAHGYGSWSSDFRENRVNAERKAYATLFRAENEEHEDDPGLLVPILGTLLFGGFPMILVSFVRYFAVPVIAFRNSLETRLRIVTVGVAFLYTGLPIAASLVDRINHMGGLAETSLSIAGIALDAVLIVCTLRGMWYLGGGIATQVAGVEV